MEGYLRCFVSDKQTQWVKWLPLAKWWYNTSFHTVAKMIPFMAIYGYHPPSITSSLREHSKVQAMEDHIEHQQEVLQHAILTCNTFIVFLAHETLACNTSLVFLAHATHACNTSLVFLTHATFACNT